MGDFAWFCFGLVKPDFCRDLWCPVTLGDPDVSPRAAVVYICTEDAFPARRLEQMRQARQLTSDVTDRILIEHVPDVVTVLYCIVLYCIVLVDVHE